MGVILSVLFPFTAWFTFLGLRHILLLSIETNGKSTFAAVENAPKDVCAGSGIAIAGQRSREVSVGFCKCPWGLLTTPYSMVDGATGPRGQFFYTKLKLSGAPFCRAVASIGSLYSISNIWVMYVFHMR
uniref:Uncharacterized protein n=1 Tax=Xenopus tropicalis TaxID=8364 RepID=A0A1B8YAU8_XENTR